MRISCLAASVLAFAGVAVGDVVEDWNACLKEAIRMNGGGPTAMSRTVALMNLAVYDTLMSFDLTHDRYLLTYQREKGTSREAAVAAAARDVLMSQYSNPAIQAMIEAQYDASLGAIGNPTAKAKGIKMGQDIAAAYLAHRAGDGSDDNTPYVPGNNPGDWRPTAPGFNAAHGPNWYKVTPWAMNTGDQFRPPLPPALSSAEYAATYNEVKALGGKVSAIRTEDQVRAGFFWANDVDGTYKPPGHLLHITGEVLDQQGITNMTERARAYAMVSLGMADAAIVAWDAKYATDVDLWRPVTGIQLGDTDGNPDTEADPAWEPLNDFSPPFPAYTSGHATFGAVHASLMATFFGTDNIQFEITSEDPFYAALAGAPPTRSFDSFSDAAWENALSRIYIGVHWGIDATYANMTGNQLGEYISQHYFNVPAPGAAAVFATALVASLRRRR